MNHSTPGLPVHHQLPESTQTHVHWVGDVIQPSHLLSIPHAHSNLSPSALLHPSLCPKSLCPPLPSGKFHFSQALFKAFPVLLTKNTPSSVAPSPLVLFCLVIICFSFGLPCPCPVPQTPAWALFEGRIFYLVFKPLCNHPLADMQ